MISLPLIFSVTPFIVFLGLLLFRKITLVQISFVAAAVALLIQIFYWKILPLYLLNSTAKGFFVAFDIFLIVFGAVFFLEVMKEVRVIENIGFYLESLSRDFRVQTILLAWFLINFLEAVTGFGTPGAIVAPILVSMGLSPLTAVVISLLGNSIAGVFGAVGTPIRVGFSGLMVEGVPLYATLFNGVGILMPVFMIWIMAREQKEKSAFFWEGVPFALWSGLIFVVSSIFAVGLGQEFVSVAGSIVAILLVVASLKLGVFVPKKERRLVGYIKKTLSLPLYKVVLPYLVVLIFLILGKVGLGTMEIRFPWGYSYGLNLFNPGVVFLLAGVPFAVFWGKKGLLFRSVRKAFGRTVDPFLVILFMSTMIQIMINSGSNTSGFPSVLSVLVRQINSEALPFATPFMGAFGAFITGSVTISGVLFGQILSQASMLFGLSVSKILALEISGAAVGNTMAIADIMTAEAAVGLKNKTREVLRRVVGPCLICLSILGVVGYFLI